MKFNWVILLATLAGSFFSHTFAAVSDYDVNINLIGKNSDTSVAFIAGDDLKNGMLTGIIPRGKAINNQFMLEGGNTMSAPFTNTFPKQDVLLLPFEHNLENQYSTYMPTILASIAHSLEKGKTTYNLTLSGSMFNPKFCLEHNEEILETIKFQEAMCVRYRAALGSYIHRDDPKHHAEQDPIHYIFATAAVLNEGEESEEHIASYTSEILASGGIETTRSLFSFTQQISIPIASLPVNTPATIYLYVITDRVSFKQHTFQLQILDDSPLEYTFTIDEGVWLNNVRFNRNINTFMVDYMTDNPLSVDWSTNSYMAGGPKRDLYPLDNNVKWGVFVGKSDFENTVLESMFTHIGKTFDEIPAGTVNPTCEEVLGPLFDGSSNFIILPRTILEDFDTTLGCKLLFVTPNSFDVIDMRMQSIGCYQTISFYRYVPAHNDILFMTLTEPIYVETDLSDFVTGEGKQLEDIDPNKQDVLCKVDLLNVERINLNVQRDCADLTPALYIPDASLDDIHYECDLCNPEYTYIDYRIINSENVCGDGKCTAMLGVSVFVYALDRELVCAAAEFSENFSELVVKVVITVGKKTFDISVYPDITYDIDCSQYLGDDKIIKLKSVNPVSDIVRRGIDDADIVLFYQHILSLGESIFIGFTEEQLLGLIDTAPEDWEDFLLDLFPSINEDTLESLLSNLAVLNDDPPTSPPTGTPPPVDGSFTLVEFETPLSINYLKGTSVITGITIIATLVVIVLSSISSVTSSTSDNIPLLFRPQVPYP